MGIVHSGPQNPNWRGGRSIASTGYVLVRVGKDHHLSDVRGYAYEHRLVAEEKLGRRLKKGEIPHHVNHIKTDNRPENIQVVESGFAHRVLHRVKSSRRRLPHESNALVACACGCGEMFTKYDASGRPRRFAAGHNPHNAPTESAILLILTGQMQRTQIAERIGKPISVTATVLSKLKRKGLIRQAAHGVWEKAS